ncbi:hypothetical protein [Pseudomonas sp. MYb185]|uniref:hypothetical protein n=1 Tax=Pseudomonas sp. MYb185 TaxID=1848729 RepID=UPI000CFAA881|nr:hypothetical protein [Pseudomonas sp. MYb185]PRB81417.1 hypothetical protein CQ007_09695 [Pseudomonas sp. MYb185]
MWVRLFLVLLLMQPGLAGAKLSSTPLHDARIQAFSLCSFLLAYYNPNQDGIDLRYADGYQQDLAWLKEQLGNDAELGEMVEDIDIAITALEAIPADLPELYPEWLTLVLMTHARLDQRLAERNAGAGEVSAQLSTVQELQLDIERLLLLYQSRAFGLLGMYVLVVDENTVAELDKRILHGFAELQSQALSADQQLAKLEGFYSFVRPHLLEQQRGWVPGSAAYYLRQTSQGLSLFLSERAAGL